MTDIHGAAPSGPLSIDHATLDGIRVVILRGEIDHTVKDELTEALIPHGRTPSRTVMDFSGVTFMDSSGINVLATTHHYASSSGGWLRIAGACEAVLRVLQIVGLDDLIDCHATLDQALTA